ncbi:MAG: RDD family protein [Gordonia sp. (in: high G+C Gram-positive bacteria)]|uniref:RDD family protein n=1 Tax=Gordonia sp. (in: high G+C Gram-positive bacteria) TaxID=84139 RepID=UPI0039E68AC4
MREAAGTWLTGPYRGDTDNEYRGQDLGLPESGPGSLAGGWTRVLGLLVDWLLAYGIALIFVPFGSSQIGLVVLGIWFVVGVVTVTLFGFTPGQFIVGTRVARVDFGPERAAAEAAGTQPRAAVGPVRALGRQLLVMFVVPALINDYNGRAMHDRATGTAIVRTR